MTYKNVTEARKKVPEIKNLSTQQAKTFVSTVNKLLGEGVENQTAIQKAVHESTKVEKTLYQDLYSRLDKALETWEPQDDCYWCGYIKDFDNEFVYVSRYPDIFRYNYIHENNEAEIDWGSERRVVTADTQYVDAVEKPNVPIMKSLYEEEMQAIEPLYIAPDEVDGHGWTASADVLKSMAESCDKAIREGRLGSKYNHEEVTEDFTFLKAGVAFSDCYIGEHFVPEGQPLIKVQFNDKDAWENRKSGELMGVSIGCKGVWEEVE